MTDPTTVLTGAYPSLIRQGIFRGVDLNVLRDRFWRLESMRADDLRSPPQVRWRAWSSNWVGGMANTLGRRGSRPSEARRVGAPPGGGPQEGERVAREGPVLRAPGGEAGWVVNKRDTVRTEKATERAKVKRMVGRTIVKAEPRSDWEDGFEGGYGAWMHAWRLTLDDGTVLVFHTEEHPAGAEYGTDIVVIPTGRPK
jgi:hypothetical protein